jgi:hypothetical protein
MNNGGLKIKDVARSSVYPGIRRQAIYAPTTIESTENSPASTSNIGQGGVAGRLRSAALEQ